MTPLQLTTRLILSLIVASICGIALILSSVFLYLSPKLPSAQVLRDVQLQTPLRVYSVEGLLIAEFGEKRRTPVSFAQVPPQLVLAIMAAEDARFYEHKGVDYKGLGRAVVDLIRYRQIRGGGSTITMQVAKNYFLSREKTFLRKFNEILLALQIERELTKEEIFELYVNKIFLGHRAYGIEAAAQVYYGKPVNELSLAQLAMIAGLPQAPSANNPISNPDRAIARRNWILDRMLTLGYIDPATHQLAIRQPVTAKFHGTDPDVEARYLAEMVRVEALTRFGDAAYTDGYKVYTTIRADQQQAANEAVQFGLLQYEMRHGYRGPEARADLTEIDALLAQLPANDPETPAITEDSLPPEQLAELQQAINTAWRDTLKAFRDQGIFRVAVVKAIENNSATLVFRDGQEAPLSFEAARWAKPYINVNQTGKAPEALDEVVQRGDIIRVVSLQDDHQQPYWSLAQLPAPQAAMVSLDPENGAITALVGGYSYQQSKYNRATQGGRQAGSVFKPVIYTRALELGFTPASIFNDAPIVFEDKNLETVWRPTGAGSKFYGPTRLREALYRSLNLVSIRLLQKITVPEGIASAVRFGLDESKLPHDLSLALGSASLTPLEVASVYAVLANGGYRVEPYFIDRILDANDQLVYQATPLTVCRTCPDSEPKNAEADDSTEEMAIESPDETPETTQPAMEPALPVAPRVIEKRIAYLMDNMLKDVVQRGTARRARALHRQDIAGKTGTTNEQVDAWFSGYQPTLVATAWMGFDDPSTLGRREYGGTAALPIWMHFMKQALANEPEFIRPQPDGIVTLRIDPETGERAAPGQRDAIFEIFLEENTPPMRQHNTLSPGASHALPTENDDIPVELF